MGLPIRSLPLPTKQLVVAGSVMPLAFAVLNQYLLNYQWAHPPGWLGTAFVGAVFVVQIGIMSALCARLVQQSWLGWVVCGWCWLLVDLQVLAASSYAMGTGVKTEFLLLTTLLAAQSGFVVFGSVLGEQKWTIRLPVLLGLAVAVTVVIGKPVREHYYDVSYSLLFLIQILGLLAACLFLRCRGYSLTKPDHKPFELSTPDWQFPAYQFGMREFIAVAAVLALILVTLQYNHVFAGLPTTNKPLNVALMSVLTALTMVIVLWSVLSADPLEIRVAGLIVTCGLAATGLILSDALFGSRSDEFWRSWPEACSWRGDCCSQRCCWCECWATGSNAPQSSRSP